MSSNDKETEVGLAVLTTSSSQQQPLLENEHNESTQVDDEKAKGLKVLQQGIHKGVKVGLTKGKALVNGTPDHDGKLYQAMQDMDNLHGSLKKPLA